MLSDHFINHGDLARAQRAFGKKTKKKTKKKTREKLIQQSSLGSGVLMAFVGCSVCHSEDGVQYEAYLFTMWTIHLDKKTNRFKKLVDRGNIEVDLWVFHFLLSFVKFLQKQIA